MNPSSVSSPDELVLPATGVASLVWSDDELVDWVSSGVRYALDGSVQRATVVYSYRFDAAVAAHSGYPIAIYERLGTKAVLLGEDRFPYREVDRSFYHADVYEYPILLFRLADGRDVLAHCPAEYCELRIEDAATGERLSTPSGGRIESMFHSRLAANPAGTRILSAGWHWHPFDVVRVFDLRPSSDGQVTLEPCDACCANDDEVASAVFTASGRLVVACAMKGDSSLRDDPSDGLRAGMIGVYDLDEQRLVSASPLESEAGTLMPVGEGHVVGFHDHPKLIELATGRVVARWEHLSSGQQLSSIVRQGSLPPPIALDPSRGRFAVADERQITVVTLHTPPLGR